ncbi:MAG: ABC transporter permease [Herpetosiphonaceae bacterium]|nr:ABC transporter permease [Herpetosiphonaceae bacterium]
MAVEIGVPVRPHRRNWLLPLLQEAVVPLLAILTALIIGAVIIWFSAHSAHDTRLQTVGKAYHGLFMGAFGGWNRISDTLVEATPYIFAGLAVALGFKCGLFNIGAEGQLYLGSITSAAVGFGVHGLPTIIHLPLAILAGVIAGGLWGAIPGYLRARTGAHEVINTIMLNYIAAQLLDYLILKPLRDTHASSQRTPFILGSAALPRLIGPRTNPSLSGGNTYTPLFVTKNPTFDLRIHVGFLLALLAVWGVWWFLRRTTTGFEIRTVGSNPKAARYAGMSVTRSFVLTMFLSGALAGMAGVTQVLGVEYNVKSLFSSGYGFDSIAVALLAKSNPIAIIPAAIFWGALNNGKGLMQSETGAAISSDLIRIIQALVIMFVAADQIVRWIYRLRQRGGGTAIFSRGWGQ